MANPEHVKRLKRSVKDWNAWRREHPDIQPDLNGITLGGGSLGGANLSNADLNGTTLGGVWLREADLRGAQLNWANLYGANLIKTDLSYTLLSNASLNRIDLNDVKFSGVHFGNTTFMQIDLSNVKGLETAIHECPSAIDINSVILPTDEHTCKHFLAGIGWTSTQIEYLPSLLAPRPIQYSSLFISYAHQDEDLARRLHTDLRKKDVPCWFAPHDLRPGTPILRGIEEAIHWSDRFLLILSKDAVNSAWIEREVDAALHQEIKRGIDVLFPIRLDNAILESNTSWATRLQHRHIGDFTGWQDEAFYQRAFTMLLRHLKVTKPPIP